MSVIRGHPLLKAFGRAHRVLSPNALRVLPPYAFRVARNHDVGATKKRVFVKEFSFTGMVTRRRVSMAAMGLGMPCIRPARARRTLTFAVPSGVFQELHEPILIEAFQRAYPDIGIFYYAVPSSTQALALLRRQREAQAVDVALLDVVAARLATEEGLVESLTLAGLPVLSELAPGAVFPGVGGPALYTEPLVMLFDPARVRPGPLTWKRWWNGRGPASIALPAPPDEIGLAFAVVAGRLFGGGSYGKLVADGMVAIEQLAPKVVSWDPSPDVYRYVSDGKAAFGAGWNLAAQYHANRLPGRLGVAFPEDGTLSRVTTVNLVRGTRQPESARQFIAWLLGAEAQKLMVERMFLGPVNMRARYLEAALLRTANTPARAAGPMPVDWVSVGALREDIAKRWSRLTRGG